MPYIYILETECGKYYVGSTKDMEKRLKHHMGGFTPSTKALGNVRLIFSQEYSTLRDARSVEKKIKNLKRRDYIEKIIKDGIVKIKP